MLKQRILTAIVLLALLVGVLMLPDLRALPILALIFVAIAIREWLTLLAVDVRVSALLAATAAILLWLAWGDASFGSIGLGVMLPVSVAWWGLAVGLIMFRRFPPAKGRLRRLHTIAAVAMPAACWLALVLAYRQGLLYLVSIMALVWIADIAAYFSGRLFGRHKLAPQISPGKTWEGVAGALIFTAAFAWVCTAIPVLAGSYFHRIAGIWPLWVVLALTVGLTLLSVVGDLFESHLKRQAGVKDSGRILPGHGGVLDRIDALLPVLPAAVLLAWWLG